VCLDFPDWKTNKSKEARKQVRDSKKIPLLTNQYDGVMEMVEVARRELKNSELNIDIKDGFSEMTYIWKEGETYCRIRPDWIRKDGKLCLDYKTTAQLADPESYSRIVVNNGLDIQDAFYRRGISSVDNIEPDFYFMVQEVEPPYLCSFIALDLQFQDMGEQKVTRGLNLWRECMRTGVWPAYSQNIYTIEPPSYSLAAWEMRKAVN